MRQGSSGVKVEVQASGLSPGGRGSPRTQRSAIRRSDGDHAAARAALFPLVLLGGRLFLRFSDKRFLQFTLVLLLTVSTFIVFA
jgi:hypothetical protein